MSITEEPLQRIKGKEAVDLIVKVLLEEGVDRKVVTSMFLLISCSLKRKITICHASLFEQRLREICRENKHEMNRGNCRKVADEILDLFYYDPEKKIHIFIMDNQVSIIVVLTLVSIVVSMIMPIILKFI